MISERVKFESQDLQLGGRLVLPDSGLAQTGVLCITGGGKEDCDKPYLEWQSYMAEEAGIASLSFNARGIGDSQGSFRTDSEDFDSETSPANSQATRAADALVAYGILKELVGITNDKSLGVIGGSMGGDVALHSVTPEMGAMILRAPSSYPDEVHEVPFGPNWGKLIRELGDIEASVHSSNFKRIMELDIPTMLLYSLGEEVIQKEIRDKYIQAVINSGGLYVAIGDDTVGHRYLNISGTEEDTNANRIAREQTFSAATGFFMVNLAKR